MQNFMLFSKIPTNFCLIPALHGTLWMDWKRFWMLPTQDTKNIVEGLNRIKSGDALDLQQKSSLEKFADLFDSVSLKDPASATIV